MNHLYSILSIAHAVYSGSINQSWIEDYHLHALEESRVSSMAFLSLVANNQDLVMSTQGWI